MFSCKLNEDAELRLMTPAHSDKMFALVDRNRAYIGEWLPWVDNTLSSEDTKTFIERQLHEFAEKGTVPVEIWYQGQLAGVAELHHIGWGIRELGYWIGQEFQGKGLVTLACKALIDHAFRELECERVQIRVEPGNVRSRGIPERLGFTYEGKLRHMGKVHGRWLDLEMFSLLSDEWRAMQRQET